MIHIHCRRLYRALCLCICVSYRFVTLLRVNAWAARGAVRGTFGRCGSFVQAKAQECKEKGNDSFKEGDFHTALKHYSEAIDRDPKNHLLYSNR